VPPQPRVEIEPTSKMAWNTRCFMNGFPFPTLTLLFLKYKNMLTHLRANHRKDKINQSKLPDVPLHACFI
jgi:hypothetical protein